DSDGVQFNQAGTFYWQAVYSGDANNNGATSSCQSEVLTIGKNSPTITTTPNPSSGTVGVTLNDSANLSGGFNPTGSITFNLYGPDNLTCNPSGPAAVYTQQVSVSGNGSYNTSPGFTTLQAGTYHWTASYSGDGNNNG